MYVNINIMIQEWKKNIVNLVSNLQSVLFRIFPKIMESLEDKWRRFNIIVGEGHLVREIYITTYEL
jgi:hypothetical protein